MKSWARIAAGVAVAGSFAAGALVAGAGIASADPPPWGPGHGHDDDGRWGPPGQWGPPPPNGNGPWGYAPPPPPWAPTAQVFWDPTRQAWGFFWGPLWFPAYW
jgi:hypothetical protein